MSYIAAIVAIIIFKHLSILQSIFGSICIIGIIFIQSNFESNISKILNAIMPTLTILAVLLFVALSNEHSVADVISIFEIIKDTVYETAMASTIQ